MKFKDIGNIQLGRQHYPSKTRLNFLDGLKQEELSKFSLVILALALTFLVVLIRFFVVEDLRKADEAEQRYTQAVQNLQSIKNANAKYHDIEAEYSHYGDVYKDDDESKEQDRITILNIINKRISPYGGIQNITLNGNEAQISLQLQKSDDLPTIIASLEESEYVRFVSASTASTGDTSIQDAMQPGGSPTYQGLVDAQITVTFCSPEELTDKVAKGAERPDKELDASNEEDVDIAPSPLTPETATSESQG